MTREKLVEIINTSIGYNDDHSPFVDPRKASDRILAALRSERSGEVLLLTKAYNAMGKAAWETGPTLDEVRDEIHAHLCTIGMFKPTGE